MYEAQITQRRMNTLKESLIFWKEKTEKLATTFHNSLKQLRADNEALKEALVTKVGSLEGEIDGYVKKIKKYYKKVRDINELVLMFCLGTSENIGDGIHP